MSHINIYYKRPDGVMSTPNSPKAKSAPATPCNVTPTAFHQNKFHINSMLHPSPANTLPPDLRHNISATCRALPETVAKSQAQLSSTSHLDELIERGNASLENKDFEGAIRFYTQCIDQTNDSRYLAYLQRNFKVFSQRAEAYFNIGHYNEAIEDSRAARKLNPKWVHAYYQQGKAQLMIGQHADSLAAFSFGLSNDASNKLMFEGLVQAALEANLGPEFDFKSKYAKLHSFGLENKPFTVLAVLGQEMLAQRHVDHAAVILESALKIGSEHRKFKGSVLSAVSRAHFLLMEYEKAIKYMQQEYEIEKDLEDVGGQCRVLSNLGYTYFKMRKYDDSLRSHRMQLNLAMKSHLFQQAAAALNALGHVHVARNDFSSALTSHTRCLEILKQLGDTEFNLFREVLSIGHINTVIGDLKGAEERFAEAKQLLINITNQDEYHTGYAMVKFNQAYLALKQQSYDVARRCYYDVMKAARKLPTPKRHLYEMRANGLGQTIGSALLTSADLTKTSLTPQDVLRGNSILQSPQI